MVVWINRIVFRLWRFSRLSYGGKEEPLLPPESSREAQIFIVLPQLPQLMSPCFVTLTFTNVNRQYGQVMVGTDLVTDPSFLF